MKRAIIGSLLRWSFVVCLGLFAAGRSAVALDPNSVVAIHPNATDVELSWTDSSPTVYCITRGDTPILLNYVNSSTALTFTETPPAGSLFYYQVDEPASGQCTTAGCSPQGPLSCGDTASGANDGAGSTDAMDSYPCTAADLSGSEYVYRFTAGPASERVTASLTNLTADLDVVVLYDAGSGCEASTCLVAGDTDATFTASAGGTYYIVVDGVGGAAGTYDLAVTCLPASCTAAAVIACSDSVAGRNDALGSTDVIDQYTSCSGRDASGPEFVYSFTAPTAGLLSAMVNSNTGDIDLYVVRDAGSGCDPAGCIEFSRSYVDFAVEAGVTYFFILEGYNGTVDDFWLDVWCDLACNAAGTIACGDHMTGRNDQAGSTTIAEYYNCGIGNWMGGPEYAYSFTVAGSSSQSVTAALTNLTADLDVFVLFDDGNGCDPDRCMATGDTTATFTASPGTTYYVVVDGVDGAVGGYDLDLTCGSAACSPAATIACGDSLAGRNDAAGSTDAIDSYVCMGAVPVDGPEYTYNFTAADDQLVTFTLTYPPMQSLVLAALRNTGAGCDPVQCMTYSDMTLSIPAARGDQFFLVVDGPYGAISDYTLDAACGIGCAAMESVQCGIPVVSTTNGPGAVAIVDAWPTCTARDESGPERAYSFYSDRSSIVTATLTGTTGDLDLLVLQDQGAGCRPEDCLAFGDSSVSFSAAPYFTYYIVVDGALGASSDFTLTLDCQALQCAPVATIQCGGSVTSRNDAAGSTNLIGLYPMCWGEDEAGPEIVYEFTPAADGTVSATLSNLTADLDVFVINDFGTGCSPDNCNFAGDTSVVFWAQAGITQYIAVDGRGGAVGDFTLTLSCESCTAAETLFCGDTVTGRNDAAGSADVIDAYAACPGHDASGPEYAYGLMPDDTGMITVTLAGLTADLDLYVLEDRGWGCEPGGCIAWGDTSVTFAGNAWYNYYVLVEGVSGAVSNYTLSVQCTPAACLEAGTIACGGSVVGRNDAAGSTDVIDEYLTCVWDGRSLSGPEIAYRFDSTAMQSVTATVTPTSQNLDILVIEDTGGGCDPDSCWAWDESAVVFDAMPGTTYYLVVDGVDDAIDDFTLDVACQTTPQCNPAGNIACGANRNGNNGAPGSTDLIDEYPACAFGLDETGPEYAYQFAPRQDRIVTVDVTSVSGDHDVFILEDWGNGCDPESCLAYGDTSVIFDAIGGNVYYIVVEGPGGAVGDYNIRVTCQ